MDQQRDTLGKEKSSRHGTFDAESLPTLFELPDRTPEPSKQRQIAQFAIHDAHNGPPAGHVDPPSGSQSHLRRHDPHSPSDPLGTLPGQHADGDSDDPASPNRPTPDPHDDATEPETRLAAYRDEDSMRWAEVTSKTWVTRSSVIFLMLVMVTLAFLSGRGFRESSDSADSDDLNDLIVITEDLEVIDELASAAETPSGNDDSPITQPSTSHTPESQLAQQSHADEESAAAGGTDASVFDLPETFLSDSVEPPSYVAELVTDNADASPEPESSLGAPAAVSDVNVADNMPAVPDTGTLPENTLSPSIEDVTDSVVAYRNPDQAADGTLGSDELPAGMESRLRLEDGLRYTDTPYPIGNFLEILKAWETSTLP